MLKREHGICFVVSFSDPAHNGFKRKRKGIPYESGGIYAASNFKYLGRTQAERHVVDGNGRMQHRGKPYRYKKRMKITMAEARQKLGLRSQRTRGKDRWFLVL